MLGRGEMIKHFVITRIGIGIYNKARLTKMIELFAAITAPSLANQSSQNFTHLIVTDASIPGECRDLLQSLLQGRPNAFLIAVDVTQLTQVHVGSFDWIWDQCQQFILENSLVENPNDYVTTSVLDADDAWRSDVVSSVETLIGEKLPTIDAQANDRSTWTRHSSGIALTFPRGLSWFIEVNTLSPISFDFHSMSVFVTSRFSSGVSCCSSRHAKWPYYAEVVQFGIMKVTTDQPMWIYSRHGESVMQWNADQTHSIDSEDENKLKILFGIDMDKIRQWCSSYPAQSGSVYGGKKAAETYDLIFRISGLNRKISALGKAVTEGNEKIGDIVLLCKDERQRIIDVLRGK